MQSLQYGVPQMSVLDTGYPSFFNINDLQNAITFSQPFHFADDTCLLNIQHTISKINKNPNKDLKDLLFWINENKIAIHVTETEIILFITKQKPCDTDLSLVEKLLDRYCKL